MVELVGLYATLNNHGIWQPVRMLQSEPYGEAKTLLSKEAAFLVLDMLAKNQRPQMEKVNRFSRQPIHVPWKTGTSVGYRDAWAIAVFDHYALGVWIGNFSGKGNNEFVGRKAAGPLLFQLIDSLREVRSINLEKREPPLNYNLEKLSFCGRSGHLPNPHCPHREQGWFVPGVSPISRCDIHRKIEIDPVSGLQVCPRFLGQREKEVYEYWPSDLLKLFKEAGIGRKLPPGLHPLCQGVAHGDIAPKILSPQPHTLYSLRSKGTGTKEIPLVAVADGNIQNLTWFVNNRKLGTSQVDKPYLWKAISGDHRLRVVDDQGRSSELFFQVKKVD